MIFVVNEEEALADLQSRFPKATFLEQRDNFQDQALKIFSGDRQEPEQIRLHLRGTTFQIKVWEALLKIPMGELGSYVEIADLVGNPRASRAVGTAIGSNPVAVLIPCHRVIQNSGGLGGYRWGLTRKSALIGWESCQVNPSESV